MNQGIAVAGNMIVDKIQVIRTFPVRQELSNILSVEDSLGGAACNVGMDLARLDPSLPVSILGCAGADEDGDKVLSAFRQHKNIDCSRIRRRGRNAFTDVLTEDETRVRTFLTYGGADATFCPEDVDLDTLDCRILHIAYILLLPGFDAPDSEYGTRMARFLKSVQDKGILTSVDVVSETGDRYTRLVPPSLPYTDYFIVNEIEAGKTVGLSLRDENGALCDKAVFEALRALKRMGVRRWAIVHTPEGGYGIDENGLECYVPSLRLPHGYIKGTVGAGDAFCAGALHSAYMGLNMKEALRRGSIAAACSLSQPGGSEGVIPMEEALKKFSSADAEA